jgi:hypothetical protein
MVIYHAQGIVGGQISQLNISLKSFVAVDAFSGYLSYSYVYIRKQKEIGLTQRVAAGTRYIFVWFIQCWKKILASRIEGI